MRLGVDVRVDAESDRRAPAQAARDGVDPRELGLRLEIDAANALFQRKADLGFAFADAGKQRLARFATRGQHAGELAAGHDVEAGAEAREQREDGEIRVCLDRIADLRVAALERVRELAVGALDRGGRVDETRRAEAPRDFVQRHFVGAQHAVSIGKGHAYFSSSRPSRG